MMLFKTHNRFLCGVVLLLTTLICHSIATATRSSDDDDSKFIPSSSSTTTTTNCVCGTISERPNIWDKVATARWMVHNIDWGVLTTISSRAITHRNGGDSTTATTINSGSIPFGNIYSFVDGSCTNSTGIPYFYGTYMDQSLQDMKHNPVASFTLSEASMDTACMPHVSTTSNPNPIRQACRIVPETYTHHHNSKKSMSSGDPESPICARLTLTGVLEVVPMFSTEYNSTLYDGFHPRHPQMSHWPVDHHWIVFKLNVTQYDLWLINYFGGATIITPEEYFKYDASKASLSETDVVVVANDPV